jgi:two-component system, sensor histidine kinase YesM
MFENKKINQSLVFKITFGITIMVSLLLAILILVNIFSFKTVKKNAVDSAKNALTTYIINIENNLKTITQGLNEFSYNYLDDISSLQSENSLDKYLSSMYLKNVLTAKVASNHNIDFLFISQRSTGFFLSESSKRIFGLENLALKESIISNQIFENDVIAEKWHIFTLNDISYLVQTYYFSDIIVGVLVKVDTLVLNTQNEPLNKQLCYALTDDYGRVLYTSNTSLFLNNIKLIDNKNELVSNFMDKYMIISENLNLCNVKLSFIQENKNIFSALELIQWFIIAFCVVFIIIIPLLLVYLFKEIIKPVRHLLIATNEVEKGNWDYRLPSNHSSSEFSTLYNSFNSMIKEIKVLKINSYEEKIELQKAGLKYLQMQIKPHFFLNAISTINSLSYQGKTEQICEYIDVLSKYLRNKFEGGLLKVPLKQQITHAKNYFIMQKIKYPNQIFYMIDSNPELENILVPNFLIDSFIENIFKHAFTYGKMLSIFLKTEKYLKDDVHFLRITIEDNGDGFPVEILEVYNQSGNESRIEGKIGISNIKKTLTLLYGRDDLLRLSNSESSGAKVQILIPMEEKEGNL